MADGDATISSLGNLRIGGLQTHYKQSAASARMQASGDFVTDVSPSKFSIINNANVYFDIVDTNGNTRKIGNMANQSVPVFSILTGSGAGDPAYGYKQNWFGYRGELFEMPEAAMSGSNNAGRSLGAVNKNALLISFVRGLNADNCDAGLVLGTYNSDSNPALFPDYSVLHGWEVYKSHADATKNSLFFSSFDLSRGGWKEEIAMTMDAYMGIGTTAPQTRLHLGPGQLSAHRGSAVLPTYTFISDLDTGLYSPALEQLALSTAGIQRLTVGDGTIPGAGVVFIANLASQGVVHNDASGKLSTSLIVNADVDPAAGIVDTKLATISTTGKVANSATTATPNNGNDPVTIVARDSSGNFTANMVTANLTGDVTGAASLNVLKDGDTMTGPLNITYTGVPPAFTVGGTRFTIDGSTGNTAIAGALGVTGATTLGTLGAGNTTLTGTLGVTGPITATSGVDAAAMLNLGTTNATGVTMGHGIPLSLVGNTAVTGTLGSTGDFAVAANKFTVAASTGNTLVAGTLGVASNLAVNTNKFTVAAPTGNTAVAGTLGVTGDFTVNTNKFNVTASTGSTTIAGTLGVTGVITATGGVDAGAGLTLGNASASSVSIGHGTVPVSLTGAIGLHGTTTANGPVVLSNQNQLQLQAPSPSTNYVALEAPDTLSSYVMKLPTSSGTSGYVLATAGGNPAQLSWQPTGEAAGYYSNGGNNFGGVGPAILGTNVLSGYGLNIISNGNTALSLSNAGAVTANSLVGTGDRVVQASATGGLSAVLPTGTKNVIQVIKDLPTAVTGKYYPDLMSAVAWANANVTEPTTILISPGIHTITTTLTITNPYILAIMGEGAAATILAPSPALVGSPVLSLPQTTSAFSCQNIIIDGTQVPGYAYMLTPGSVGISVSGTAYYEFLNVLVQGCYQCVFVDGLTAGAAETIALTNCFFLLAGDCGILVDNGGYIFANNVTVSYSTNQDVRAQSTNSGTAQRTQISLVGSWLAGDPLSSSDGIYARDDAYVLVSTSRIYNVQNAFVAAGTAQINSVGNPRVSGIVAHYKQVDPTAHIQAVNDVVEGAGVSKFVVSGGGSDNVYFDVVDGTTDIRHTGRMTNSTYEISSMLTGNGDNDPTYNYVNNWFGYTGQAIQLSEAALGSTIGVQSIATHNRDAFTSSFIRGLNAHDYTAGLVLGTYASDGDPSTPDWALGRSWRLAKRPTDHALQATEWNGSAYVTPLVLTAAGNLGLDATGVLVTPTSQLQLGSGQIATPLGNSVAPSYSFTGDLNTGLYSPGANSVALSVGGTGGLLVNADTSVTIPYLAAKGVVHNLAGGNLQTSLIVNNDVDPAAGIVDTKLATISTPGKVLNSATTATPNNGSDPVTIVARDSSGNFTANMVTANLTGDVTGAASRNVLKAGDTMTGPLNITYTGVPPAFTVGGTRFTIDGSTGNTAIAGTLGVASDVAVNTNKFTVAAGTGNTAVAGTLGVASDFAINASKFNVTASSGDTAIAGVLGVTGLITATGGVDAAAMLNLGTTNATGVTIGHAVPISLVGNTAVTGTLGSTGDFAVAANKFTVAASTGNTLVAGTLGVASNLAVNTNKFTVAAGTGNTAVAGTLGVASDFAINASKFNVTAANGNTTVAGTLGVAGLITATGGVDAAATLSLGTTNTTGITIGHGVPIGLVGATTITGVLSSTGDFAVNTNKFNVAALTGNTAVAGTLGVASDFAVNTSKFTVAAATGNTAVAGTLGVASDLAVNTNKVTVEGATGNTAIAGTLGVTGIITATGGVDAGTLALGALAATTINIGNPGATVGITGDTAVTGTLSSTSDFAVNTNKFTVVAATGNTTVAGTLGVAGDFAVNTNKFTVASGTGNTTVAGTLGAGNTTITGTLGTTGDFAVNTNKFTVASGTGNTTIAGTLSVTGGITATGGVDAATLRLGTGTGTTTAINIGQSGVPVSITGSSIGLTGATTLTGSLGLSGGTSNLTVGGTSYLQAAQTAGLLSVNNGVYFLNGAPCLPQNMLQVTKGTISGPNQFNSITAAMAAIPAVPTTTYVIEVGPGTFIEDPIVMKRYVALVGSGSTFTIVHGSSSANDVITAVPNTYIADMQIEGGTDTGKAGVAYHGGAGGVGIERCAFGSNDILVYEDATSAPYALMQVNGCAIFALAAFTSGLKLVGTGSHPAIMQVDGLYWPCVSNAKSPFAVVDVSGARAMFNGLNIDIGAISTITPVGNTGASVSDGASCGLQSSRFHGFTTAIDVPNVGAAPHLVVVGSLASDNATYDIHVARASTTGTINGVFDRSKLNIVDGTSLSIFVCDPTNTGTLTVGPQYVGDTMSTVTNISPQIQQGANLGVLSGGDFTEAYYSGGNIYVDVDAGDGYVMTMAGDYLKYVQWSGQTGVLLTPNAVNYLYINESGTALATASGMPDRLHNVYLGQMVTDTNSEIFCERAPESMVHTANQLDHSWRDALGPIYVSGSIAYKGLDPFYPLQVYVPEGVYYFGTHKFMPAGASPITFNAFYGGGVSVIKDQTDIDYQQYNPGGGGSLAPITSIPTGWYARHSLYVVNGPEDEYYLLVYGQQQWETLTEAVNGGVPPMPGNWSGNIALIASVIVQNTENPATGIVQVRDERPILAFKASGVTPITQHDDLSGRNLDANHLQYLLISGTRAMTGNLQMGGNSINITGSGLIYTPTTASGMDVGAHALRHAPGGADALPLSLTAEDVWALASNPGSAVSFARSDHHHFHGNLSGGSLHAVATPNPAGVAGFMSASDKTKLDAMDPSLYVLKAGSTMTGALAIDSTSTTALTVGSGPAKFTVSGATGNTAVAGTLGVTGDLAVNTDKFNVIASTGNTAVAGTLGVASDFAVNANKFNVTAANGNTAVAGTLGVVSDFAINTNKFNVTASSGDTAIAGTLGVTGLITAAGGVDAAAMLNLGTTNATGVTIGHAVPISLAGNTAVTGTLSSTGDFAVATNKFTVAASTGNALVAGTLGVASNLAVNTNKFTVVAGTGNTAVAGTLGVASDFAVNTNKFNVTAASGNTSVAGTLGVVSDFAVNTNKFNVIAASGNTTIAGVLGVTGLITATGGVDAAAMLNLGTTNATGVTIGHAVPISLAGNTAVTGTLSSTGDFAVNTNKFNVAASTGNTTVAGTLGVASDFAINTDKFTVAASTGNTAIAGTLDVTDTVTLTSLGAGVVHSGASGQLTSGTVATSELAQASSANNNDYIVVRDGSGNFAASTITATGLNVTGKTITLNQGSTGAATSTGMLVDHNSSVGAGYLRTDGADATTWVLKPPAATGTIIFSPGSSSLTINQSSHDPVSLDTANGLSLFGQQLSLAQASGSTTGALSNTDWNTFSGKQAGSANLTSLAGISTNGFIAYTGSNTFASRTLTGTTDQVYISNAAGGLDPVFRLPQSIGFTSTPQFANLLITTTGGQGQVRLVDAGGTNTVSLQAPSSVGTSYALTLPTGASTAANQVLASMSTAGALQWVTNLPGYALTIGNGGLGTTMILGTTDGQGLNLITNNSNRLQVASDGTITVNGFVSAGTDQVVRCDNGVLSAGKIFNAQISDTAAIQDSKLAQITTPLKVANNATTAATGTAIPTTTTIVARDTTGSFAVSGTITATSGFSGNLTGNVTGNVSGTSSGFTGSLVGDVTGGQITTAVAKVGGVLAANVASGANAANAATDVNTYGAIVKRDGSGNFSATTITANLTGHASDDLPLTGGTLTGALVFQNGHTNTVTLQPSSSVFSNYALTFPTSAGTDGYVLTTNGTGTLSWQPTGEAAGAFINGGNNFGGSGPAKIGTTSAAGYGLWVISNGVTGLSLDTSGNVSVSLLGAGVVHSGASGQLTSGTVATSELAQASSANNNDYIVVRDGSGNFAASTITATGLNVTGKTITLNQGSTGAATSTGMLVDHNSSVGAGYLRTDGADATTWVLKPPAATGTIIFSPGSSSLTINQSSHDQVSLGTANGLSLFGQQLSLAQASGSTTGALSNTDWNTFSGKQAGSANLTSLAGISTNGFIAYTGSNTFASRTLTGTTDQVYISNATGGLDPVFSLPQSIGFTSTPQFANLLIKTTGGQGQVRLVDAGGTNTVSLQAPSSVGTSYALTLPTGASTAANQVLASMATAGALQWVTNLPGYALTIGNGGLGTTMILGTTDGQGLNLITNGSNRLQVASDGTITVPGFAGSTNGVVKTTTAGVLSASLIGNGDIGTSSPITDDKLAQITTPLKVANNATTAATGTAIPTTTTIVARDTSGSFAASGTITATGGFSGSLTGNVTGTATGNVARGGDYMTGPLAMRSQNPVNFYDSANANFAGIRAPSSFSTVGYTLTLPSATPTNGYVLSTDGSGNLSWVPSGTSAGYFINGGNSFTADAHLGTNDEYNLYFKTFGSTRMVLDTTGKVGILQAAVDSTYPIAMTGSSMLLQNSASATTHIGIKNSSTQWGLQVDTTGSTNTFNIRNMSGGIPGTARMTIDNTGVTNKATFATDFQVSTLGSGVVHSDASGNFSSTQIFVGDIADGAVSNAKLQQLTLSGLVANGATTATTANTYNTIVLRDGTTGGFSAGTITATLSGHATNDLPLAGGTLTGALAINLPGAGNALTVNSPSVFTVDGTTGNTSIGGTLGVSGQTTLSSTLGVTGDLAVNTNKFKVIASSGNTTVAGTLGVASDFAVNTSKFTVAASTGNTAVAGTLSVASDFAINANKFNVTASSGDTAIAGTLGVTGSVTASSALYADGGIDRSSSGALNIGGVNATSVNIGKSGGSIGLLGNTTISNGTSAGTLYLQQPSGVSGYSVGLQASSLPVLSSNLTYVLPTSAGTNGYVLTTDGNNPANLAWTATGAAAGYFQNSGNTFGAPGPSVLGNRDGYGLNIITNDVARIQLGAGGSITLPGFIGSDGVVKSTTGVLSSGLIVNGDITDGTISNAKLQQLTLSGLVANGATTATTANTINAIVLRDVTTGGFSAGTISATFTGNLTGTVTGHATSDLPLTGGSTSPMTGPLYMGTQNAVRLCGASGVGTYVGLRAPSTVSSAWTLTFPDSVGTGGQMLVTDGNNPAQLSWQSVSGAGAWINGGNGFGGGTSTLGTTDGNTLNIITGTNPSPGAATRLSIAGSTPYAITASSALYADGGLDVTETGVADTLNIGPTNADIVNVGRSAGTVNIKGETTFTDKLVTLNKGGAASSAGSAGIELEENSSITGYAETSVDRNSWTLKAPNTAGIVTVTPGLSGFTIDQGSHNPVTIGTANGLSLSTQQLSMALASGSTTGALSSGDWTTFNGKQAGSANLTSLAGISTNGFIAYTGSNTFAPYTLTGTTNQVSITNGSGGGNPVFSLPQNIHTGATPTFAGLTISGSGTIAPGTGGVDVATLNLGTTTATAVNIGRSAATVGITGSTIALTGNTTISDKLVTLNKGGAASSAGSAGIELEENSLITGYAQTSADRNSWTLKAPNTAGIVTVTPGLSGFTIDQGSHNPVTIGTANGLSLSTQQLSMALASGSTTGALSSGDWTTFNGKQAGSANLTSLAGISTNGFIAYTGSNTFTPYTLTGTTNQVSITNGSGGGNPVFSLPQNIHTGATPTFAGLTLANQGSLQLQQASPGTTYVALKAPAAVTTYTVTMPGAVGASGQVLKTTDAAGTLGWDTAALNNGNTLGAALTLGTNDLQDLFFETNNTSRMIIDSTGKIAIGQATVDPNFGCIINTDNLLINTGGGTNTYLGIQKSSNLWGIMVDANANNVFSIRNASAGLLGTVKMQIDNTGATNMTTFNTDLTVNGTTTIANGATAGKLQLQQASGTNYVGLQAPAAVGTSYTLTFPSAVGGSGQVLKTTDAAGTLGWDTAALNNGNTLGAALTLGTNDAQALNLETNGTVRLNIDLDGNTTYSTTYKAAAIRTTNQAIGAAGVVLFNSTTSPAFDPHPSYTAGTGYYNAPYTGYYMVSANVCVYPNTTGMKTIQLRKTAANITGYGATMYMTGNTSNRYYMLNFCGIVQLTVGDNLNVYYTGTASDAIVANYSSLHVHYMST